MMYYLRTGMKSESFSTAESTPGDMSRATVPISTTEERMSSMPRDKSRRGSLNEFAQFQYVERDNHEVITGLKLK